VNGTSHRCTVDVKGARAFLSRYLLPVEPEQAGIINAYGRTLAQDVTADTAVPMHDEAAVGGYAVISSDTIRASRETPADLSVLSTASPATKTLQPGTVMRVREGDPLPAGADAVVPASDTYRPDQGPGVLVFAEVEPGTNLIPAGSRSPSGEVLLRQGACIGAVEMEVIAAAGKHGVAVRRRPRIAIVTTGAGVVDLLEDLKPGDSRNAARYGLVGMLLEAGCDLGRLIHVREGRPGVERALAQCTNCDAIILALGSRDKHDMALDALANAGTRCFDRVQIEPGSGCAFGIASDVPVFVTEGGAALETFEAIIRPGLMLLLGRDTIERPRIVATLDSTLKLNPGYEHFMRAHTCFASGKCTARPLGALSSQTNSLIVIGQNVDFLKRGEDVDVMLLA